MAEARVARSVSDVAPADWDRLFPHLIERHATLAAIEGAGLPGFEWRYLLVEDRGRLVAAAPAFLAPYDLATTMGPGGRRVAAALRPWAPRLVAPRLACLGSPCTEVAPIGLAPELDTAGRDAAAGLLLGALAGLAAAERADVAALKDVAASDAALLGPRLDVAGFGDAPGLPTAWLPVDFPTLEAYLARLSPGTRRDVRRKLRSAGEVRVERTRDAGPVVERVMALYAQTRGRAAMAFEELTPAYFAGTLADERASLVLYWRGDALAGANLLIEEGDALLDKFFLMDAELGRPLNLYFLSWFENVRRCLERGLGRYLAGQAGYAVKLRLGCRLEPTRMYFRHRNRLLNRTLALAAPRLSPDPAAAA